MKVLRHKSSIAFLLFFALLYPAKAHPSVELRAERLGTEGITIDGRLTEPAWKRAPIATGFVQREPYPGEPATEKTTVMVLYDEENLYIGAILYDREPHKIIADEMRRDGRLYRNDTFAVLIDTYHDHRNGYFFETNPLGARLDAVVFDEGREVNTDWDGVWYVASHITEEGWQVEMKIPFSTLRFDSRKTSTWGLQLRRIIRRKNEEVYWAALPLDASMWRLSLAGHLTGLEGIRQGRNIELKPYILTGIERAPSGGSDTTEVTKDMGIDLKYAITPHLTLDLTANTDFAQVEADELSINITRFPLFFPEKREFFLEGSGFFQFGLRAKVQPFFSRRIGLSGGKEIPILAGAKLTGKVGDYGIGLLNIETKETSSVAQTSYTVMRLKKDILERSRVGIIAINKEPQDGSFNRTIGADTRLVFMDYMYITSFVVKTYTKGVSGNDTAGYLKFMWYDPRMLLSLSYLDVAENFNPEVGFVRRTDIKETTLYSHLFVRPKGSIVREYSPYVLLKYIADQKDQLVGRNQNIGFSVTLHSGDSLDVAFKKEFDRLDYDFEIRPSIVIPEGGYNNPSVYVAISTDDRRTLSGTLAVEKGDYYGGDRTSYSGSFNIVPARYLKIAPRFTHEDVSLPAGSFRANLLTTAIEYTITTRAFLNALLQWNDDLDQRSFNIRFNYEYMPNSDIYIVYNERHYTDTDLVDRILLLKLTYMFTL